MSVLEVRDLTIALPAGSDRKEAVSKVSFSVDRGEIVCLVGESGSGKSTLFPYTTLFRSRKSVV